jgi:DNA-binding NarL/FixJ family response regulator
MSYKKLKILLIEDNSVEVDKLKRAISQEFNSFNIFLANNTEKAITLLKTKHPDVILLDLDFQDTNGIEFLSILKKDEKLKSIPVIILTSTKDKSIILECYKLNISGYLLKSLKEEEYTVKINAILKYLTVNEFIES